MWENADYTLDSLKQSSYQDFKTVVVPDQGKGACWARNEGFKQVDTEFVLFSDNDIQWTINGIQHLVDALDSHPEASYSYGINRIGDYTQSQEEFDPELLKKHNYISTMSVIRTKDFPGFDESIKRFQDWDVWLNLLINEGKVGVNCNKIIFYTPVRSGITEDREPPDHIAIATIKKKYNLNTPYL
jgi:glycosyltransferase involved in cell wall biosynthesis